MSESNNTIAVSEAALIQSIVDNLDGNNKRFAFLLGAGASVSSGIPAAGDLAAKWLAQLESSNPEAYADFKSDAETEPAKHYSAIYKKRFQFYPEDGYSEIKKIMTGKDVDPSLGYILLMSLLSETDNNVIITTNFDRLPETALLTVFNRHAKVIYHESILAFSAMDKKNPIILKIHNDAFFQPKSDGITELSDSWKTMVKKILQDYHLIVLGYGGNDQEGLMQYLLETGYLDRISWCYRNDVPDAVKEKPIRVVKIQGFDEFIYALYLKLPYDKLPKLVEIQNLISETAKARIQDKITTIESSTRQKADEKDPTLRFLESFTADTWWDYQLQIEKSTSEDEKDRLYQEGISKFPESPGLRSNYASFLTDIRKDHDKAEGCYRQALKLAPDNAIINGNYAVFLTNIREDHDKAEGYYRQALELDPDNANINGNYAFFLTNIRNDHDKAEGCYRQALKLAPDDAIINGNYAFFLTTIRKDHDKAEEYYGKALELDPDDANINGNYAVFLTDIRKDHDKAEDYYRQALELAPDNANINGNYALFLKNIRKEHDKAEDYYRQALELDQNHANNNGNYAGFLLGLGQREKALPYLEKAEERLDKDKQPLKIELLFYRFAHFPDEQQRYRQALQALLQQGVRSIGWNFDDNIQQAEREGCNYLEELRQIAKDIGTEAEE